MEELLKSARKCRHYAMCKIDYLGTGLCNPGKEKGFVAYYPQGRMDLYAALAEHKIPVTEKAVDIAEACDLCGKCDYQCYFTTEMKPMKVMEGLKNYVEDYLEAGKTVITEPVDEILKEFRAVTGNEWSTADRAIAITYAHDPSPLTVPQMPDYVLMPGSVEEVTEIMKIIRRHNLKWAVRGNGSSVMGFVMSEGVVIDMGRMKEITLDEKNWKVKVGPGVSAFELQQETKKHGYRVNIAEPEALVCANILCSGIFSTWSATYGTMADNLIDAEFVSPEGTTFNLNSKNAPNLFAFEKNETALPGICVSAELKLHPVFEDEQGILVPFENLEKAVDFARECAARRKGIAIGILGGKYISSFIAPTGKLSSKVREVFEEKLKISYLVQIIGDQYDIRSIKEMGAPFIDQELFRTLMLGLPALTNAGWLDLFADDQHEDTYGYLKVKNFRELAETALMPSAELLAGSADPELISFFERIYQRPEMSDLVWLNDFRILSSRMGRDKHVVAWIIYLPVEFQLIDEICASFRRTAENNNIEHDYGFITPIHFGKRCILEYDYFLDHNNNEEIVQMRKAVREMAAEIERFAPKQVKWIRYVLYQGMARSEHMLYC